MAENRNGLLSMDFFWPFSSTACNENTDGNLRLPAYRGSHLGRFHPYPRVQRSSREENYLSTVDIHDPQPPLHPAMSCSTLLGRGPIVALKEQHEKGELAVTLPNSEDVFDTNFPEHHRNRLTVDAAKRLVAFIFMLRLQLRIAKSVKEEGSVKTV